MSVADRFEQSLVLRVGRAVPLSLAAAACLALAGALLVLIYSVVPVRGVREPAPASIPPDVVITASDVHQALAPRESAPAAAGPAAAETRPQAPGPSAGARTVATALHGIRDLVPESLAPWRDVYERRCREVFFGNCYGEYQQLVRLGLSRHLTNVTDLYDAENSEAEYVEVSDARVGYVVNGSQAERKSAVLRELASLLAAEAPDRRAAFLRAWASLRVEKEQARLSVIRAEQRRIADERADEEARVASARISKTTARASAATIGAGAIGLLWTIALALAVLAIERNTRALKERGAAVVTAGEPQRT